MLAFPGDFDSDSDYILYKCEQLVDVNRISSVFAHNNYHIDCR